MYTVVVSRVKTGSVKRYRFDTHDAALQFATKTKTPRSRKRDGYRVELLPWRAGR